MSKIEWTEKTWNPVTGCTKISAGCKNCYAERMSHRLQSMGLEKYRDGFKTTLHPDVVDAPVSWRTPLMIFVNSMSDLFHEDVPDAFIHAVFQTMQKANHHTYQILTKRPERVCRMDEDLMWLPNIWLGTSIENSRVLHRVDALKRTSAHTKFLSCEPLLGPLTDMDLEGIGWVIVGGESGPGARPMHEVWATDIRDQCVAQETPFFFKQWGGVNKKTAGRTLGGRVWDQYPERRAYPAIDLLA